MRDGNKVQPPEAGPSPLEKPYRFADLSAYSFKQRWLIRLADLVFYCLIQIIGHTIRWEIEGWENWEAATSNGQVPIYTFWHNRIFLGTYFWRQRGIVVMTSQSFDGEYIARFIQRLGYGAARGSSTRGGIGALVEMIRLVKAGTPVAFSIDGPKGPLYIAKPGAVLLSKKTGAPVLPFCLTPTKYWTINSWDKFQIPRPFTRALLTIAPPIFVPATADEETIQLKQKELQIQLDDLVQKSEVWRERS